MQVVDEKIQLAAELIKNARYAIAFTGAGISTPSGIPDFRSPECGLWTHADPMQVASIQGFRNNPRPFYDWVIPLIRTTQNAQPNAAHFALAQLEQMGYLKAVITQNIDMLHSRAGSEQVYELHGHLRQATCISCYGVFAAEPLLAQLLEDGRIPRCRVCGGVLKPNVILFGEQLPVRELQQARMAARQADVMIIAGSSLEVEPASELPRLALRNGAKLIMINLDANDLSRTATVSFQADVATVLPEIVQSIQV